MRITRLTLRDIGPFDDVTFDVPEARGPGEVVLFEGPNGSGKTTVVESIAAWLALAMESPGAGTTGAPVRSIRRRARPDACVSIKLADGAVRDSAPESFSVLDDNPVVGAPCDGPSQGRRPGWRAQKIGAFVQGDGPVEWAGFAYRTRHTDGVTDARGPAPLLFEARQGALSFSSGRRLASALLGQEIVSLECHRVRADVRAHEEPAREDLARAALASRYLIERISHCLSCVVDRRVEVRFSRDRVATQLLFDGAEVPVEHLGDGLCGTFSWVADLLIRLRRTPWRDTSCSPFDQEFWLLLDDVDQGLHPQLQARLYPALREAFPRARIYGTTHSPFVVASLGDGAVFSIRPDPRTRRVTGQVVARHLRPGNSLSVVVEEVFAAPSDFVDAGTREALQRHREAVDRLRRGEAIDVDGFARDRLFLLGLNEDVAVVVAMREAPARRQVDAALSGHGATG